MIREFDSFVIGLFLLLAAAPTHAAKGTVEGKVSDGGGQPLAGVDVESDGAMATMSDKNGDYTLEGLKAGTTVVKFSKVGYKPRPRPYYVEVAKDRVTIQHATLYKLDQAHPAKSWLSLQKRLENSETSDGFRVIAVKAWKEIEWAAIDPIHKYYAATAISTAASRFEQDPPLAVVMYVRADVDKIASIERSTNIAFEQGDFKAVVRNLQKQQVPKRVLADVIVFSWSSVATDKVSPKAVLTSVKPLVPEEEHKELWRAMKLAAIAMRK